MWEGQEQLSSLLSCFRMPRIRFGEQLERVCTSRRFCRSFSLSLRILCCSALSARRFSCSTGRVLTGLDEGLNKLCWRVCEQLQPKGPTILSFRWISSSSSFFLLSKWTSIKVWSSIRSFSILLRWISCRDESFTSLQCRCLNTNQHRRPCGEQIKGVFFFLLLLTYIKIHLFPIRNFRRDQVGRNECPEVENDKI